MSGKLQTYLVNSATGKRKVTPLLKHAFYAERYLPTYKMHSEARPACGLDVATESQAQKLSTNIQYSAKSRTL